MKDKEPKEKHEIIAIGGTGQMVLHLYATWYLIGGVENPFRALVVDTDAELPSLKFLRKFFSYVQAASGQEKRVELPEMEYLGVGSETGRTVEEELAGRQLADSGDFEDAVQAFFSKTDRKQSVKEGLFARPALSAVLSPVLLWEKLGSLTPPLKIGLVCSTIGGTGAGLTLPIISFLQNQTPGGHSLRAVFLGRFFEPDPNTNPEQRRMFQSNEALFHESRRHLVKRLDHFALIQPAKPVRRNRVLEQQMRHWPWPEKEDHPYWAAASALKQMLTDTTRDIGSDLPYGYTCEASSAYTDRLRNAYGRAESFAKHAPFLQIRRDIFVPQVWSALHAFIASYADYFGADRAEFARLVQDRLRFLWWRTPESDYALSMVLPVPDRKQAAKPSAILNCAWEPRPAGATREILGGLDDAALCVAARALFILLHSGGAF